MDATGPRDVAKQQYANVRRSLTDFEERVVARYWDEDTLARTSFEWLLGSLDLFAGWFLADEEIARRGQDLMRQTSYPARPTLRPQRRPSRTSQRLKPAWSTSPSRFLLTFRPTPWRCVASSTSGRLTISS